jgi:acetyl-CoA acetyltransferase
MRKDDIVVAGVGMYPFGHHNTSIREMAFKAGTAALRDAVVAFPDVGEIVVGHCSELPGSAVRIAKEFGLTGAPVVRVESASATGSVAFRAACDAVALGRADVALALGYDAMDALVSHGTDLARMLSLNSVESFVLPVGQFAMWARRRMHEGSTTAEDLARVAAKNWNYAARCEMAHRRVNREVTVEDVLASSVIADPLTSMMCAPIGRGAAAAVVCRYEVAKRLQPGRPLVRVAASALQSERFEAGHVFVGPVVGPSAMTRSTSRQAYEMAAMGPEDIDVVQVHDAFAIEELVYYELLGFCGDGEAESFARSGATAPGGQVPFSTDGGLIGRGHPGGPTGLAQIWETVRQLRAECGDRQVENARVGMCHMLGGGSVCIVHLLEAVT